MRLNWKRAPLAMLTGSLLAGAGCSGINTTQSVSPLMFLLPGIGKTSPAPSVPGDSPAPTTQPVQTLALAR